MSSGLFRLIQTRWHTGVIFPSTRAHQHAVHAWLVGQREAFTARLMGDPDYYDVQVAGRWLYGIACWIGSGWCSGEGPWQSVGGSWWIRA